MTQLPRQEAQSEAVRRLSQRLGRGQLPHHMLSKRPSDLSEGLASLLASDCIRATKILETVHSAVLHGLFGAAFGVGIDRLVRGLYPKPGKDDELTTWPELGVTLLVVLLQVVLSAIGVIYIRKLVALFPFLFNLCPSRYVEGYGVDEVEGEISLGLAYVGSQSHLVTQLEKINAFFTPQSDKKGKIH